MTKLKLIKIGNSLGAVFPKDLLAKLNVIHGDELIVTDDVGGVHVSAYDPVVEQQIDSGRDVMRRYRHALKKLAE